MSVSGPQRADLLRFGREVARLPELRLVILRNAGRITDEEFTRIEEIFTTLLTPENIVVLLDAFDERCRVDIAVNELIPLVNMLRDNRQAANRVRTALRALRGGDG